MNFDDTARSLRDLMGILCPTCNGSGWRSRAIDAPQPIDLHAPMPAFDPGAVIEIVTEPCPACNPNGRRR